MHYTYYGQSCFMVEIQGSKLLFDPFITGNPLAKHIDVNAIEADYILLSHGHYDHVADCVPIANRTGAMVIAAPEVTGWLKKQGVQNTHSINTGGKRTFGTFTVKCTAAQHSSSMPDGSYGGCAMGFIITSREGNFYYSGDTALTMDMELIPTWAKLNFAVLPIGDNFTMDAADAAKAAEWIECMDIIGVHYDTFDVIKIDHEEAKRIFSEAGLRLHLVDVGKTIEL